MPIETIDFNGQQYPKFQSTGNAARFIMPFAQEVCKGNGLDVGYSKHEWKFPGAVGVDAWVDFTHSAWSLPDGQWDYIFSSHMLEHVRGNWADLLDYWSRNIRTGGVLFLYLPHPSQTYWLPWNNRKHIHSLNPDLIRLYLESCGWWKNIFVSGADLNNSYAVMAEKM
jgi:SAM-dependent methyltransferase